MDEKLLEKVSARSPTIWINIEFHLSKMHELSFFRRLDLLWSSALNLASRFSAAPSKHKVYFRSRFAFLFRFNCAFRFMFIRVFSGTNIYLLVASELLLCFASALLALSGTLGTDNQRQCRVVECDRYCERKRDEEEERNPCDDPSTLLEQHWMSDGKVLL